MHSKKHLSFTAIRNIIAKNLATIKDTRAGNSSNSIIDVMLSGLACMYYQSPSLLEFQRKMEKKEQRNNLRSMFTVQELSSNSKYTLEAFNQRICKISFS
jgi:hypothetical protein